MNPVDFINFVVGHAELTAVGGSEERGEVYVRHNPSGRIHALAVSAVRENSWEDLEAVLTGKRRARVLEHISRIVGYWSRIWNWNRSKLAELADRRKGDYGVPAAPEIARVEVPPEVVASIAATGAEMSCRLDGHAGRT